MTPLSVRAALMAETENHRTVQGAGIYSMLRDRLFDAFPGYVPAILPATGTAAVEAMIVSCSAPDSRTLILANGYYSERTGAIAEAHRMPYDLWKGDWFAPLDQEAITKQILSGKYSSVVVTHHETSTSRLNDLGWLSALQSEVPFRLLVDAVSSVGADELGAEPEAFCLVPNKCFHGVTGLSVVMVKESLVDEIRSNRPHALFLDLNRYLGDVSPGTVPVGIALAFCAAIDDWLEGGGSYGRRSTYLKRRGVIFDSLTKKGYQPLIPIEESSCSLTVWRVPKGFTSSEWLLHNERNGYALFPCKGELADEWYQVSVMGAIPNGAIHDWTKLAPKATT